MPSRTPRAVASTAPRTTRRFSLDDVLARRLATQRLTGPALRNPASVVRELVCVQAQDAPLSRYSIGLRSGRTDAEVRAVIDAGEIVRTHILRPTWHYVSAKDLRWILELTSTKQEAGLAARHRQLGIDEALIDRTMDLLRERLNGRNFATRTELGISFAERRLVDRGHDLFGQRVGHLLMIAEFRALICSGPMIGNDHSYALVDDVVPRTRSMDREEAICELVKRFVASHGPVDIRDIVRWSRLTQAEIMGAIGRADGRIVASEVGEDTLWFVRRDRRTPTRPHRALLLSRFDEAYLTYLRSGFPRPADHPGGHAAERFAEAGGGPVICDLRDVGTWKRTVKGPVVHVSLSLARAVDADQRDAIEAAADRLADFTGLEGRISYADVGRTSGQV
ncbi:MAG: winged helix DNA-binding domain-containing protein, partial [Actinomycetota bacterium]